MRELFTRAASLALCVTVALGAAAAPCSAADPAPTPASKLTKLSAASRQVLARKSGAARAQAQTPSSPDSFFKSTRGKVTLALMGAGVVFTIWSINHDRKPVKSPVR